MTLNAHYYGEGEYVCYALRFMGGDNKYVSAYKWEPVFTSDDVNKTKIQGLKVTCRLLGPDGASLDVKTIAKDSYWNTNNSADVVRYFPASGYGNYTADGTVMDQNSRGRYWSVTPRNEDATGAWGFGFDSDFVMVYPWVSTSRYCLRCFKTETDDDGPVIPSDATVDMQLKRSGIALNITVEGPKQIDVDFGDSVRTTVDLTATQGLVQGTAKGTNVKLYASGVTALKAQSQQITTINLQGMEKLKTLDLGFNKLTAISVDGMPELEYLNLASNKVTAIDVTKSPKLKFFSVSKNSYIKTVDLSNSKALEELYLGSNDLESVDLTAATALKLLDVSGNSGIKELNLANQTQLQELYVGKTSLTTLDITACKQLVRLNTTSAKTLSAIKFANLAALQSCYINQTALPKAQLDPFIDALPDVNKLQVLANERGWKKQLEVDNIADVTAGTVDLSGAKAKGWKVDVLDDAWSVTPKTPCVKMTTAIPVKENISFKVQNIYDPFWVDWGNWWSSFLKQKPYTVKHAVRQADIDYYSRGLETLDCSGQKLTKLSLPDNDQTYLLNAADNELTEFSISPTNSLVTIDLRNNQLSAEQLDAFFANLRNLADITYPFVTEEQKTFPENEDFGKIFIAGNPGAAASNKAVAINKGYTLDVTSSISDVTEGKLALNLSPNPAADVVRVSGVADGTVVRVYSLQGSQVLSAVAQQGGVEFNVTSLNAGLYIVTAGSQKAKLVIK